MADKSYKSYQQQLNILRSRGMVIGLASKASATTDEVYKTGTTFDEVYALYNFDRELRNIYLPQLSL